jgi:hypothetical protein
MATVAAISQGFARGFQLEWSSSAGFTISLGGDFAPSAPSAAGVLATESGKEYSPEFILRFLFKSIRGSYER